MSERVALYFGCWDRPGHYLHGVGGRTIWNKTEFPDLPWAMGMMDGALLENGKHPDVYDGRVFWTGGGRADFWYAFVWWDRSMDQRRACNSGFYMRGFEHHQQVEAFAFACEAFPLIVGRQAHALVLQP